MKARYESTNMAFRCDAVACFSERIRPVLDAAILLVVSVCAVILRITS